MRRRGTAALGAALIVAMAMPAAGVLAQDDPSASPAAPETTAPGTPAPGTPAASAPAASEVPGATAATGNRIPLPNGWQPEGITSDGDTLYVGSLVNGAI